MTLWKRWKPERSGRGSNLVRATVLLVVALESMAAAQQAPPTERLYNHPQVDIQKAIEQMQAYDTQRLPALAGFVNAGATLLDHLQNPRFQLHIDLVFQGASQTVVRVSAKITAWYEDPGPSRSQYTVVPSNGRLEEDFLDRLSMKLERGAPGQQVAPSVDPPSSATASVDPEPTGAKRSPTSAAPPRDTNTLNPPAAAVPSNKAGALAGQISALRAEREALEQNERKLQQQISELQSASRREVYLKNMAVIRTAQTPLFEQNQETSKVLFRADPDDEFPILEVRSGWVRVGLEKGAEAWLRSSQLRQPADPPDSDPAVLNFNAANEEVKTFGGDWTQLKGKTALYVFAQPARQLPAAALGQNQLQFAEYTFVEGYRAATHSQQQIDGVVVVFLGQKGGVAAATLADIRRWHEGYLTDKLFLDRCSLDPADSFHDGLRH
jgi:hypothetical protein